MPSDDFPSDHQRINDLETGQVENAADNKQNAADNAELLSALLEGIRQLRVSSDDNGDLLAKVEENQRLLIDLQNELRDVRGRSDERANKFTRLWISMALVVFLVAGVSVGGFVYNAYVREQACLARNDFQSENRNLVQKGVDRYFAENPNPVGPVPAFIQDEQTYLENSQPNQCKLF